MILTLIKTADPVIGKVGDDLIQIQVALRLGGSHPYHLMIPGLTTMRQASSPVNCYALLTAQVTALVSLQYEVSFISGTHQ